MSFHVPLLAFGASGGFGAVSIFSLESRKPRCFWYKGCFRHLHTDNQGGICVVATD
jgi:hypothetical protein